MGSGLLRRATGSHSAHGPAVRIEPADEPNDLAGVGWQWVAFAVHRMADGSDVFRPADDREVAVLVLEGTAEVTVGDRILGPIGGRPSVFAARPPGIVLAAPDTDVRARAIGPATVALTAAPAGAVRETRVVDPATIEMESRGAGSTAREVRHVLPPGARAGRLILFEVVTPGGHWSSYPPHKHDMDDPPMERRLEELYYFRFERPAGYALARIYAADASLDVTVAPADGDVLLVPRGYHVVSAAPGYDCYYLNVMAGPTREWRFTVDPAHAWLMDWQRPA